MKAIMKMRAKAELRSSLIRTIVLGLMFGLTFFRIEKTQTEPRLSSSVRDIVSSLHLLRLQALFALNGCIFFAAILVTPFGEVKRESRAKNLFVAEVMMMQVMNTATCRLHLRLPHSS